MTDEQLMLLEQLTYLDNDVAGKAGVSMPEKFDTVEDLLEVFNEETLAEMEGSGEEGETWAAIIREIQSDPELRDLKVTDVNNKVYAICFEDPKSGEAIVAFRGTATADEWADNAYGLAGTGTLYQEAALEYVESLPYDNGITVVGHSKGGNKAQYVTILSDKVDRCVSMDGQGFSPEFLDKYYAEIQEKAGLITNYYLDGDFVNILLYPIPGAEQICIDGGKNVTGAEMHYSASFFQYYTDAEGNWYIRKEDGQIMLLEGKREEVMQYLHELTSFVLNVMPKEQREEFGVYIGALLAIMRKGEYEYKGVAYTSMTDLLLSDQEMLGLLLSYVLKYAETYNLTEAEITSLMEVLGLKEFFDTIRLLIMADPNLRKAVGGITLTTGAIFLFLMCNLKDGERDKIIESLLGKYADIWVETEKAYGDIPNFDEKTANKDAKCKSAKIRDFSQNAYNMLMGTIAEIEANTAGSIAGWAQYAGEEWYDDLFIDNAIKGIGHYFSRISEINALCTAKIDAVFESAVQVDTASAAKMSAVAEGLRAVIRGIQQCTERVS